MNACTSTLARMSRIATLPLRMRRPITAALLSSFEVPAAAVSAQPVQSDHVHGDDGQRPEWVGGDDSPEPGLQVPFLTYAITIYVVARSGIAPTG